VGKKLTLEEFIRRSQEIHKEEDGSPKYDYTESEYINGSTKIKIICKVHGSFLQNPHDHLAGKGCSKCGFIESSQKAVLGKNIFLERAKAVHGDKYNYSLLPDNLKTKDKIKILCQEHGVFEQEAKSHTLGIGCPKCGNTRKGLSRRIKQETFISKAIEVHGNKYDYSKVIYEGTEIKIILICSKHKEFNITPHAHLSGQGCRSCGYEKNSTVLKASNEHTFKSRFTDQKPAILYYVKIKTTNKEYYKIGVTTKNVTERFRSDTSRGVQISLIKSWDYEHACDAYKEEMSIIRLYKGHKTKDTPLKGGNGEVFDIDVLKLDLEILNLRGESGCCN